MQLEAQYNKVDTKSTHLSELVEQWSLMKPIEVVEQVLMKPIEVVVIIKHIEMVKQVIMKPIEVV